MFITDLLKQMWGELDERAETDLPEIRPARNQTDATTSAVVILPELHVERWLIWKKYSTLGFKVTEVTQSSIIHPPPPPSRYSGLFKLHGFPISPFSSILRLQLFPQTLNKTPCKPKENKWKIKVIKPVQIQFSSTQKVWWSLCVNPCVAYKKKKCTEAWSPW